MKPCPICGHNNEDTQLTCEVCYLSLDLSLEWIHEDGNRDEQPQGVKEEALGKLVAEIMGMRIVLNFWVIGTTIFGSLSLWIVGLLSGGIGMNFTSTGGHIALLIGGAILGAGVGLLLFPIVKTIVKMVSSALAGERWALLGLGISAIAFVFCALQIWRESGGNLSTTILGALVGSLVVFYIYKYVAEGYFFKECPFCAETIKYKAIVCRYCGRDLSEMP